MTKSTTLTIHIRFRGDTAFFDCSSCGKGLQKNTAELKRDAGMTCPHCDATNLVDPNFLEKL